MSVRSTLRPPSALPHARQAGLTLIELLVAMALGLLIALAAAAVLVIARQGFSNVDAASQLRDNGRFVQDLVQRLGAQTGFKSLQYAATTRPVSTQGVDANPPPNVYGLNNASRTDSNAWDTGTARTSGTAGYGSDILVLRYQTSVATLGSASSDGTMIDCTGTASATIPTQRDTRLLSILHVGNSSDGEPALMCTYVDPDDSTGATLKSRPLIKGVENFQVLYGIDGIGPGNTAALTAASADSVPERYLRADQLTVSGNVTATYANWQRVRSLRIGLVLRGATGSAIDSSSQTFYPLGTAKGSSDGAAGSAFASSNDPGTTYSPTSDRRLRQAVTFTVHLRNFQEDL